MVHVDTTYMNVVDPRTGQNLWGDSEREGSWFVAGATKDLIEELRETLEVEDSPTTRKLFLARFRVPKVAINEGK